jgi:gliding motility-associated-like protein
MQKILSLFFFIFSLGCFSQAITVDTSTYTVPQLVSEVLVDKSCVPISNISWRTGTNFGSSNGIGYFENTNPMFPLSRGVILSTGDATNAAGPNGTELSDGNSSWTGDSDLEATLLAAGITVNSTNATVLEFDFVPFSSHFDFRFVFASEEYGNFQCQFSDAFTFLLTNTVTGVTTNLAVVPGTTIPISVTTIRDYIYNSSCPSENPTYFGAFNGGSEATSSATNFNGQTVTMSASSNSLVPNTPYHIKLVIADRQDFQSDSAIFLGATSFNVGQDVLGPDLTVANSTALCENTTHTIESGLDPAIFSFEWTLNGNPIGGNTPDLTVSQAGVYGLTYTVISTSCPVTTDFITIEYYPPINTSEPLDIYKCNSGLSSYTFDLSINNSIVSVPGTTISYHDSQTNANSNSNPLPTVLTFSTTLLPTPIWMRIEDNVSKCFTLKSFQIGITPPPVANFPGDMSMCETQTGNNTANFLLNNKTSEVLGGQSSSIYEVSYYTKAIDADTASSPINPSVPFTSGNTTIFARIQTKTDPNCYSVTNFKLIVISRPILDQRSNQYVCSSYKLPPLVNPGNYFSGPNQGLPLLNPGDEISSDQVVYLYNTTATSPSCPVESSFNVLIIEPSDADPIDIEVCDSYRIPNLPYLKYFTQPGGPSGGGTEILGGTVITTAGITTVYTYFVSTDNSNPCILEGQFNITINKTPILDPVSNVFACSSYNLPPLTVGNYYTFDSITGIYTPAVSPITTTTTLYVFASNNGCRTANKVFTVYIGSLGLTDVNQCVSYNLRPAPVGQYRDAPNGGGNIILPGVIEKTTTIYTFIPGASCTTDSFTITINAPFISTPSNIIACDSFLLPTQAEGADYYTLAGGPSTSGNVRLLPNVDIISSTTTIYLYKPSTTLLGCYNEKPWQITINQRPKIDSRSNVDQCNSYVLSPLKNGAYYDDPNGVNPLSAGTIISTNNRIYIYAANPNDSSCFNENYFDITINGVIADPIPSQLSYCESFTFPPLPSPNNFYYDAPGGPSGGGNQIPFGTRVTANTLLPTYYIYTESGGRLNCKDEKPFSITITPRPIANPVLPLVTCDSFGANDGIFQFDLTSPSIRNQVLNGQSPDANFTLSFYNSLSEANNPNAIPIANPATYLNDNPFSDSIWIRVANNTSAVACFDVVELALLINSIPEPQLESEYFLCEDYSTGTLLNSVVLDCGVSGSNYLFEWTLNGNPIGGNTPTITTTQVGDYSIKVTNSATNCSETASTKVIQYAPYLEITYSDAFDNPTFITANVLGPGSGNYEYQLDDLPFQDSNKFTNVAPGEHTISVNDKNGHCNPAPLKAVIINYPKFFTPNGDGYNEKWNIPHLATTNPKAPIRIYDRYGKFLKQISPTSEGWNGIFNGQPLPSTDYWFTVEYDEKGSSKIFKSHFTLKR